MFYTLGDMRSVNRQPDSGEKPTSEETISEIRKTFNRTPTKPIRRVSRVLRIRRSIVYIVGSKIIRALAIIFVIFLWFDCQILSHVCYEQYKA